VSPLAKQYFVVSDRVSWTVRLAGSYIAGPYPNPKDVIRRAIDMAHADGKAGYNAQVIVQGDDSVFRTEWTYGRDPYPPKG
jgi:hypothetical protein